jgi:hypothetical protein
MCSASLFVHCALVQGIPGPRVTPPQQYTVCIVALGKHTWLNLSANHQALNELNEVFVQGNNTNMYC